MDQYCVIAVNEFWGHSVFELIQNSNIVTKSMNFYIVIVVVNEIEN